VAVDLDHCLDGARLTLHSRVLARQFDGFHATPALISSRSWSQAVPSIS
jgi:hypothetical protein